MNKSTGLFIDGSAGQSSPESLADAPPIWGDAQRLDDAASVLSAQAGLGHGADELVPPEKRGLFARLRKPARVAGAPTALRNLPVQVVMGFLPEVAKRDALEYAMGMADKYVTQVGIAFFTATPFEGGYIYEVHEGGDGKAFGPEIVRHFMAEKALNPGTPVRVVIPTAQRMVEVTRERVGLSVVLLPESTKEAASDWLVGRSAMTPAVPRRKGMLIAGLGLFISGAIVATATGMYFRLQGYLPAPSQPIVEISPAALPYKQWDALTAAGRPIKAIRYERGAWVAPEPYAPGEPSAPAPTDPGTPVATNGEQQ